MTAELEADRSAWEELERIERAISDRILYNPGLLPDTNPLSDSSSLNGKRKRPIKQTVTQQHEIARFLDRYRDLCEQLCKQGNNVAREQELAQISAPPLEPVLHNFMTKVQSIQQEYTESVETANLENAYKMRRKQLTRNSAEPDQPVGNPLLCALSADLDIDSIYSGEEYYGQFLDLHSLHEQFLNLKVINRPVTYIQYLDLLNKFSTYPDQRVNDAEYLMYTNHLKNYLVEFLTKTRVLGNPLATVASITDSVDINTKKIENNPLFCKACDKLFASSTVFDHHLKGRKHLKNSQESSGVKSNRNTESVLANEKHIVLLTEVLDKELSSTRANAQRRQGLTNREWLNEIEEREAADEAMMAGSSDDDNVENDGDSDEETGLSNPLNLPLDVTGRPIPFWLYKLHGLGHEFRCQICGDHVYMGRKEFDGHFTQARHLNGLKALGIKPSSLFKDISVVAEALALWQRVRRESSRALGKQENIVQVEDDEGNVMTEKIYKDLKNQGLI